MSKFSGVLLIIVLMTIVGCIESNDEFTVNSDGSGKVIYELTFPAMGLEGGLEALMGKGAPGEAAGGKLSSPMAGAKPSDLQAKLKDSVSGILSKSSGIDTWKDVSYKITDDGRMYFKGAAYFPDINNLRIRSPDIISSDMMKLSFARNQLNEITIEIKNQQQPKATGVPQPATAAPAVPEDKLDELVRQARSQYEQSRPMIQAMFSTLKGQTILHLPGQIKEFSNFEKVDDSTVRLALDGSRLIGIVDRMMQDEASLKEQIRTGRNSLSSGPNDLELNEMLFGQRAPVRVVITGATEQLFDYKAEVAAAKANYASVLAGLAAAEEGPVEEVPAKVEFPAEGVASAAPEEETGPKVIVGGVRLVRHSDYKRGVMPLGQNDGYTLSLIVELPVSVVKVSSGIVEKAITDTGRELLPKDEWNRKIKFPSLANDGKTAVFDVELLLPDDGAHGLEEVSGTLEYLTASGSREADLGVIQLEVGAKGAGYGAVISSIEADPWQKNATVLGLRMDLPAEAIRSVEFYADGAKLDINQRSSLSIDGTTTLKFSVKDRLPQSARVVLNVFDELKKDRFPFRVRNVSLTGQPLR